MNAIEEAQAYQRLIETIGLTQESLAERVGRDRSYITNYLRLLRLPEDVQRLVQEGKLSAGHARTLLGSTDVDVQRRVARKIIERGLSVRETERLIRRTVEVVGSAVKKHSGMSVNDPNIRAVETKLRRRFGTQVRVIQDTAGSGGKIEIAYYEQRDLERIYNLLIAATPSQV